MPIIKKPPQPPTPPPENWVYTNPEFVRWVEDLMRERAGIVGLEDRGDPPLENLYRDLTTKPGFLTQFHTLLRHRRFVQEHPEEWLKAQQEDRLPEIHDNVRKSLFSKPPSVDEFKADTHKYLSHKAGAHLMPEAGVLPTNFDFLNYAAGIEKNLPKPQFNHPLEDGSSQYPAHLRPLLGQIEQAHIHKYIPNETDQEKFNRIYAEDSNPLNPRIWPHLAHYHLWENRYPRNIPHRPKRPYKTPFLQMDPTTFIGAPNPPPPDPNINYEANFGYDDWEELI